MNLQEHPTRIKNDIEDQSLQLLSLIKDSLVVIGGWEFLVYTNEAKFVIGNSKLFEKVCHL